MIESLLGVVIYFQQGSDRTDFNPSCLHLAGNPFLMKFISASGTAVQGAPGHLNFSLGPVNLGIMFMKPGMS